MIRFSERDEDVNFKGSQLGALAARRSKSWRLLLLFEGFTPPPRLHETNPSPDVAATSEQTDLLITDRRGVRVPGITQSLQESTAGSGTEFCCGIPAFPIIFGLIGRGVRLLFRSSPR